MRSINACLLLAALHLGVLSASAQMPPPPAPPPIPPELLNQSSTGDDSVATAAAASAHVSPAKRALILEYMQLSGRSVSAAPPIEQMMGLVRAQLPKMTKQLSGSMPGMISGMTSRLAPNAPNVSKVPPLTSMQQKAMMEDAQEAVGRITQRSGEILAQNKELPQIMEDTFVSVYDKYLSEQDLMDIIAFYHTPIGEKLRRQQAAIDREMMTLTMTRSMAPIGKVMQQVQQEEELFAPGNLTPSK
ncbi:MAG: DUF2059 domain-containing protein [Candidatus Obscuribacterales bacterium]